MAWRCGLVSLIIFVSIILVTREKIVRDCVAAVAS